MKRSVDFRNALGSPDADFERTVISTLNQLKLEESEKAKVHPPLWPRKAIVILASLLTLSAGIALAAQAGHWGIMDWLRGNHSEQALATELPFSWSGDPVDTELASLRVREAVTDGLGIFLSVEVRPKHPRSLVLNFRTDPFAESPESIGKTSDYSGQTIMQWAVAHNYQEILRAAFFSKPSATVQVNSTVQQAEFDSYWNNKLFFEEDGSTLIMAAGGYEEEAEIYELSWSIVPWDMTQTGRQAAGAGSNSFVTDQWTQGTIPVTVRPAEEEPEVIAAYTLISDKTSSEAEAELSIKLLRTSLYSYYEVQTKEAIYLDYVPILFQDQGVNVLAPSDIYLYNVKQQDGAYIFLRSCELPEQLPDHIDLRWIRRPDGSNSRPRTILQRIVRVK